MTVETASDLASMFDDEEFAEAASYLAPAGGATEVDCLVIVDRGQGREKFVAGEASSVGSQRHLWVRQAELADVARGGQFTMLDSDGVETGEVFEAADMPKLDQTGALWSVDLLIVD